MSHFTRPNDGFLQSARFPAPPVAIKRTLDTTDVSDVDIGLLDPEWKAKFAIRDTLAESLCDTLSQILGQTPLDEGSLYERFHLVWNLMMISGS
jgi:hypothetical protein